MACLPFNSLPKWKGVLSVNYLRFQKTGALETLLFQPGIRKTIGIDVGAGFVYRPALNENIVITAGATGLFAGAGFDDIYSSICSAPSCGAPGKNLYNAFVNLKLAYGLRFSLATGAKITRPSASLTVVPTLVIEAPRLPSPAR